MYSIYPIRGSVLKTTKAIETHLVDTELEIWVPILTFLILADDPDDDTAIIVDTGVKEPDEEGLVRGREVDGGGPTPLREGLEKYDVTPEDIDYVILTHLHWDHADNNEMFPNAEFFVQREAMNAAENPLPPMQGAYSDEILDSLQEVDLAVLDGEHRIREGIDLVLTPGHAKGQQSVIIETETVPHAIISDLAYCRHNLDPSVSTIVDGYGETLEVTPLVYDYHPPGIHIDIKECYESIDTLRERIGKDGVFLAAHIGDILSNEYPQ
jgi:glyoxylase-like metal-dependent hydrolase (beta-lactamase superfamily II)